MLFAFIFFKCRKLSFMFPSEDTSDLVSANELYSSYTIEYHVNRTQLHVQYNDELYIYDHIYCPERQL